MQVTTPIQMKIIRYLSRTLVCQSKLWFQTAAKPKPDPRIVGSNRTRDQLWPPSSLLAVHSPGHQLNVVFMVLQGTETGWVAKYKRRMRVFNLEVIFAASILLAVLITLIVINW